MLEGQQELEEAEGQLGLREQEGQLVHWEQEGPLEEVQELRGEEQGLLGYLGLKRKKNHSCLQLNP